MSDNEDIVVSLEGDDHEQARTAGADKTDPVADLKSQFDTVKQQAEADRQRAEAAERRANAALQEANRARDEVRTARSEVTDRELDTVVSGIAQAQAEAEKATADFAAAAEAGDFAKQAEAQRRIARAEARIGRLDEAKADIEVRRSTDTARPRSDASGRQDTRSDQRQPPSDPVEAFIQTRDTGTQEWLRAHPDEARALILDPNSRKAQKLTAADADAVAEGYVRGSPRYFEHIESFVGLTKKEQQPNGQNGSGERQRRSSPPAAPVSGSGGSGGGMTGGTEVKLSSGEATAATDGTHVWNPGNRHPKTGEPIKKDDPLVGQPIGTREFARRKLGMQKEGRYDNPYVS